MLEHYTILLFLFIPYIHSLWTVNIYLLLLVWVLVEKKKETITESAGRQQKKKIGKSPVNKSVSIIC